MEDLPVACTLGAATLQERRQQVLEPLQRAVQEARPLEAGYAFRFEAEDAVFDALTAFLRLERACCAFLKMTLTVHPGGGPLWLTLTGPEGTRALVETLLLPDSDPE